MAFPLIGMSVIVIVLLITIAIMEEMIDRYRRTAKKATAKLDRIQREYNRLVIAHDMSMEIATTQSEQDRKTRLELLNRINSLETTLKNKNAEIIHLKTRRNKEAEL